MLKRLASRHNPRRYYPPAVFERVTDILADLVLEDLKQYPQIPSCRRIDRFGGRKNTVRVTRSETKALKVAVTELVE